MATGAVSVHLSFRARLMTIVGATGVAFLLVILVSGLIGLREERKLTEIERRLVPRLALGPLMDAELGALTRGLQDAAGAQDPEMLAETRLLRDRLLATLASAPDAMSSADLARVRTAIEDYFDTAYDVAKRLVQGDRGEASVRAMGTMQEKLSHLAALLKETTRLDRSELTSAFAAARDASRTAAELRLVIVLVCLLLLLGLSVRLSRGLLRSLADVSAGLARFGSGDFTRLMPVTTRDELGALARDANQMAQNLGRLGAERDRSDWLKSGQSQLVNELRGELDLREIAQRALRLLASHVEAAAGAFYFVAEQDTLQLISQFALSPAGGGDDAVAAPSFRFGEGLVGQAALAPALRVIEDPPRDYLRVRSGLGEGSPKAIVLVPLVHVGRVTGVLELALFRPCSDTIRELLGSVSETLAIALEVARSRGAMRDLLAETRRQAQRLANQEHELTANNEELRAQQENLTRANEELEEQRRALEENNVALEESRQREEKKSQALADASAYKSRFLSNMSHELRTPLNSMLLLSNLLSENSEHNLTEKQVDFAKTIHSAGQDLLALINQVLDLAKIEAGKQEIFIEPVPLAQFPERAQRVFTPLAHDKGLELIIDVAPSLPESIVTDRQRVDQILTNLLGNAIKFTEHGSVTLRVGRPVAGARLGRPELTPERTVALVVSDTGIGIAHQEQERVFAPFQQIDARTDRRYGGSGLGLSIARELALLLGGELQLESAPGKGSTFTLYLPAHGPGAPAPAQEASLPPLPPTNTGGPLARVEDDRETLKPDEPHLLIIEDDPIFAAQLAEIIHARRFKVLIATEGREGLRLAKTHRPQGIVLDVRLPDIDGWVVMERLGFEPETRRIPVHFVSSLDAPERGLAMGAVGYLSKPATREELVSVVETLAPQTIERSRRILVVEDDTSRGERLVERLEGEGLQVRYVQSGGAALQALEHDKFSCIVLDLGLPDMDGLGFLERLRARGDIETPPVVVHTGRALTKDETRRLEEYAEAVVLKEGRSTERLLEEIRMFIQHVKARLPQGRAFVPPRVPLADVHLDNRRILLVDDDMRTVYALSALLRAKGAEVLTADTGRAALEVLGEHPDTEGVLMDVMMPEMDGYEAMRRIRQDARFERLPVIALTAKAMRGEREKCIEAGASDYLTKPIDADQLLTMLQAWLAESQSDADRPRS
jgi:CheY-like chemotaxis protein/HAMP domain-containing protein